LLLAFVVAMICSAYLLKCEVLTQSQWLDNKYFQPDYAE